jgi:hypothetical protein
MTVVHEANGYVGGYLVANAWGRPMEFRLSTAVQPNRVQQILYGQTLEPFIFADLIGKALVDRTSRQVQIIFIDRPPLLDLRERFEIPVAYLEFGNEDSFPLGRQTPSRVQIADDYSCKVFCHSGYPSDAHFVQEVMNRLRESIDLSEPFSRVREAIAEARRMGATARA